MSDRELLYSGKALTLMREQIVFPDGHRDSLEIIRHPGGAGAVALDEQGQVCLIRQYRYAADGWLWEIPAGRIEQGEKALSTAQRELAEEAGICAEQWQELTDIFPSPGICDEHIHLYLAKKLRSVELSHDRLEYIEIHWIPLPEALHWCRQGQITDAKTQIALFHAQQLISDLDQKA